jgi:processive 1,2-diacylglycerol beta-glucosyltransferase
LLIVNPIPGQESANSDFLLSHGAAVKVNCIDDIPARVENLLGSGKLAAMRRAAIVLGRPKAAETICEEVLRRLGAEFHAGRRSGN